MLTAGLDSFSEALRPCGHAVPQRLFEEDILMSTKARTETKTLPNVVTWGDRNHEKYLKLLTHLNNLIYEFSETITAIFINGEIQLPEYIEERLKRNDAYFEVAEAEKLEDSLYALRAIIFSEWINYDNLAIHLEEDIRETKERRETTVE